MSIIEKATQWMINIANDASHGYDQVYRWGEKGDYDCSSMNITGWQNAGVPVKANGATYTGNMYNVYRNLGFADVTASVNLRTGSGLQRGDVLLNHVHHVAQYIGGDQLVQASINEKGTAKGGQPGDQKQQWGKKGEINICGYYNYPWNCVLRYTGSGAGAGNTKIVLAVDGDFGNSTCCRTQQFLGTIMDGIISSQPLSNKKYLCNLYCVQFVSDGYETGSDVVRAWQILLQKNGYYKNYKIDGLLGYGTVVAIQEYLRDKGYYTGAIDGSFGPATVSAWQRYLNNH